MDSATQGMIDRLLEKEGGYVNDLADPGGETRHGISKRQYPALDIKNLTRAQARHIYERDYLIDTRINRVDFLPLREQLFDFAVNSGPPQAVRQLQRLVDTTPDGLLGPITLAKVNTHSNPAALNNLLVNARLKFLDTIIERRPRLAKFRKGWITRVASFRLHT